MGELSIALCCCNGGQYIDTQLKSLACQTRQPDELIVCDDRSDDDTAQQVMRFARRAPFPVRLVINPRRLGATANFDQAIGLCQGRLIALCDQDDRWHPAKLEALEQELRRRDDAGYAWCDALLTDPALRPSGRRLWQVLGPVASQQRLLEQGQGVQVLVRNNVVTGAMMMFRAELRDLFRPIPQAWMHDAWIALVLTATGACAMVQQPLADYRQHPQQQIGARRHGLWRQMQTAHRMEQGYFQQDLLRWEAAVSHLDRLGRRVRREEDRQLVRHRRDHARRRLAMRNDRDRRHELAAQECWSGGYGRFAMGWRSLMQDLVLSTE